MVLRTWVRQKPAAQAFWPDVDGGWRF